MHFLLVIVATIIALFWDEALITIIGVLTQKQFSAKFLVLWIVCSGILTAILISFHVPSEYRLMAMIMITIAVFFNMKNYRTNKI
jgi:hypothetical protein